MARRSAGAPPLRGVHILLVCDDDERSALFADALRYAGALVTTCGAADEARAVLERLRANVIVAELREATERARLIGAVRELPVDSGGGIPALALTPSYEDAKALLAAGYHEHLAMPVRAAELCASVVALARQPAASPRL
jgi:CheY-like chemotaxis protein